MTRHALRLVMGLALLAALAAPASAQSVAGTWQFEVNLDAGTGISTFVLTVEDGTISGTYSGVLGDVPVTGTVDGNNVEIHVNADAAEAIFEGTLDGDTIEGTADYVGLGSGTFVGTRGG